MNFSLFIALRFIRASSPDRTLSLMLKLCFIGIMVSTGSLALVTAIMHGFQNATLRTLKGMSPDIILKAPRDFLNPSAVTRVITEEFSHDIIAHSACSFHHVLIQLLGDTHDLSHVITLGSIDPQTTEQVMPIVLLPSCHQHQHQLTELVPGTIIIGATLAHELHVACGDRVTIRYIDQDDSSEQLTFSASTARIVGILHSGLEEWDLQSAFISFEYAEQLFNDGALVQQMLLKAKPHTSLPLLKQALKKRLHILALTWQDLNPALLSALTLEKYAMMCILALMMLIACITTMALLCMQLIHHQKTISVLSAYGMPFKSITRAFILFGMMVTGTATLLGLLSATIISSTMNHYQLIRLPNVYYTAYVPAEMSGYIACIVLLLAICVSGIATWYPARRIRFMPIARILSDA